MKTGRLSTAAIGTALITLVYGGAAFLHADAEVYLFPRIIAVMLLLMTLLLWGSELFARPKPATAKSAMPALFSLLPGLVIGVISVLLLERLGFYLTTGLAFFAIAVVYDRTGSATPGRYIKKLLITVIFIVLLYLLFAKGLYVQTPTGWFV